MKHRFRFHGIRKGEFLWELVAEEWHHILKVLRLEDGDVIELGDGMGWSAVATLFELGKQKGNFRIESESYVAKTPKSEEFTLGIGILKPQGIDEILPGLVELGMNRLVLIPFHGMDRSRLNDKLLDRWQRQIIAAAKQAKAAWFPELVVAKNLEAFLARSSDFPSRYLLDPSGEVLSLGGEAMQGPWLGVVGSEGGWSEAELEDFRGQGFKMLSIHANILRATTAALATTAIFRQALASQKSQ